MKTIYSILVLALFIAGCTNSPQSATEENKDKLPVDLITNPATASADSGKNDEQGPAFTFEKEKHDFGTIVQGEKVSYAFKFTNSGNADLLIKDSKASCGCTVPEYSKAPIPPGGEGSITVTFDSQGKSGMQHKDVTIIANTIPNTKVLVITGEIVPPNK